METEQGPEERYDTLRSTTTKVVYSFRAARVTLALPELISKYNQQHPSTIIKRVTSLQTLSVRAFTWHILYEIC